MTFRDAPPGSYVSEEGWLIVGDEAWTLQEWDDNPYSRPRSIPRSYDTDDERLAAKRRANREYMRRKRAA